MMNMRRKENKGYKFNINGFNTTKQSNSQITFNKRGNSLGEKHLELEPHPLSNIITQVQKKTATSSHELPMPNERPFSLSPMRMQRGDKLLPPKNDEKKTLILDLDETLVHSDFTPFPVSDLILKVEIDGNVHNIYILIRPGVQEFLNKMAKIFEIVVFTASISKYAEPLLDILDKNKSIGFRLFRDHCTNINGIFIKELKRLNRDLKDVIIVDNSPLAYAFNPENGLPIKSWYDERSDDELNLITPILEFLSKTDDVRKYISHFVQNNVIMYSKAQSIFLNRKKEKQLKNIPSSAKPEKPEKAQKKSIYLGFSSDYNGKNDTLNIKKINITNENKANNQISITKEAKSTQNKNSFRFSNTKNDFFNGSRSCLNNDDEIKIQKKDNSLMQSLQLNNQNKNKLLVQNFKVKLGRYTSLIDKRDILNINAKMRPSSSTKILREPNDSQKAMYKCPSFINVNISSSAKGNVHLPLQHYNTMRPGLNLNLFQAFGPKTPTQRTHLSCNNRNCVDCQLPKNNYFYSTRNSNNANAQFIFNYKKNNNNNQLIKNDS